MICRRFFSSVSRNSFEVLGVTPSCTLEEAKTAYRGLVMKLHPDITKNDPKLTE